MQSPSRLRRGLADGALIACAAIVSFALIAQIALEPRDPSQGIAVVFSPWTGAEQSFTRAVEAGGRFVRYGGYPFIAVVAPEAADYAARARENGAWLIADPRALAACFDRLASSGATR